MTRRLVLACSLVVAGALGCSAPQAPLEEPRTCRVESQFRLVEPMAEQTSRGHQLDYSELRPFRSYVSLGRIGPFAHHFQVWFSVMAPHAAHVEVVEDEPPVVRILSSGWGGLSVRPQEITTDVPPEMEELADAARSALCQQHPNSVGYTVVYLGSYRTLHARELVPWSAKRSFGVRSSRTFKADRDLTRIEGIINGYSATGALCLGGCGDFSARVDYAPPIELVGRSLLYLYPHGPRTLERDWARFRSKVLEAARRLDEGNPSPGLETQEDTLLPRNLRQLLLLRISVIARARTLERQQSKELRIMLPSRDAVFGTARGNGELELGGVTLSATAELSADHPASDEAIDDEHELGMTLRLHIEDHRGRAFDRRYHVRADTVLDRSNAAIRSVSFEDSVEQLRFPAQGRFRHLDVMLRGLSPRH